MFVKKSAIPHHLWNLPDMRNMTERGFPLSELIGNTSIHKLIFLEI